MAAPTYVGTSAVVTGTTAVSPTYPTGVAAGDMCVIAVVNRPDTVVPVTPASWSRVSSNLVGTGTQGAGTGQVRITVFVREAASALTGTQAVTITSGTVAASSMTVWRRDVTETWAYMPGFGHDVTSGTGFSAQTLADPGLVTDDVVLAFGASAGNVTGSAQTVTATGATIGAVTERVDAGSATGNALALRVVTATVTAGVSTAAPVYAETLSAASTGGVYILRLRPLAAAPSPATLAVDASSPAGVTGAAATTFTTASFTPPVGALLVAFQSWDTATIARTSTVTTFAGSTTAWQQMTIHNTTTGFTAVDYAIVNTSTATQVRMTFSASTDGLLTVMVFTGFDTTTPISQIGSILAGTTATIAYNAARVGSRTGMTYENFNGGALPTSTWGTTTGSNTTGSTAISMRQTTANPTAGAAVSQLVSGTTASGVLTWVEVLPGLGVAAATPFRRVGKRTF